jgi:hypothetical protein
MMEQDSLRFQHQHHPRVHEIEKGKSAGSQDGLSLSLVADVFTPNSILFMITSDITRQRFQQALANVVFPCTREQTYVIKPVSMGELCQVMGALGEIMWPLVDEKSSLFIVGNGYVIQLVTSHMFGHRELKAVVQADRDIIDQVSDNIKKTLGDLIDSCQGAVRIDVTWYYMGGNETVGNRTLTEELHEVVHQEAYPYFENLDEFVRGYLESESSVLLMMGTQGTGKTRLIRYIVQEAGRDQEAQMSVIYTSDMRALSEESMFIDFKCGDANMMVLEDIDDLLVSRRNGNPVVHKFLASSDGFVAARNKKIILSTNLFVKDIDEALIRPGRCYACVETRPLDAKEASVLALKLGKKVMFSENATVAEVYDAVFKTSGGVKYENKLGF